MSTLIRFILTFSLLTLLLFSQSLPTSSAAAADGEGDDGEGVVLVPFRRVLLSQQLAVKAAGEKVVADDDHVDDHLPHKLGIHMRKARSGGGGVATRARGKTSSAVPTHLSSFHFASLLACSFFLALILL